MSAAMGYIPSLHNGVSQEPGPLRDLSRGSLQVNCVASVEAGLAKRPPTEHIAVLESGTDRRGGASVAHIFRQDGSDYVLLLAPGGTMVLADLAGNTKTLTDTAGASYRTTTNPRHDIRVLETPTKLYLVNQTEATSRDSSTAPGTLKGAKQLFGDLSGVTGTSGDVWEIAGDPTTGMDNYYAKWDTVGVWREGLKPGEAYQFDASTLPHVLVPGSSTDFEWTQETWVDRSVGDVATVPFPAWEGAEVLDMFSFQGRLGFVSESAVGLSRVNQMSNWWPRSRLTQADDDPLSLNLEARYIHAAVSFDRDVILFTNEGQYSLLPVEGGPLTPSTVSAVLVSSYGNCSEVKPVRSATSLFFACQNNDWAVFREIKGRHQELRRFETEDLSAHAPEYIPTTVYHMAATTTADMLCVLTEGEPNAVYVYQYHEEDRKRVQSAWSKWEFDEGAEVIGAHWVGSDLYLVVAREAQVTLERMRFFGDAAISDLGYEVLLDRRVTQTGSYDAGTGVTTWTLPYGDATDIKVITGSAHSSPGVELKATLDGTSVTVAGDYSAGDVYLGQPYEARYRFSPQFSRTRNGVVKTNGYLLLSNLDVSFDKAGAFHVEVTPFDGAETSTYRFYSWKVGSSSVGEHKMQSGSFRVPVNARALNVIIDLVNDTHLPTAWTGAEWFGEWFSYAED